MITKPTVLVLGAGVSMPYGYPSGGGLLREIFMKTTENQWRDVILRLGFSPEELLNFRTDLHQSQKLSIDAFLEHRPEFMNIGKAAIAMSLLDKEIADSFGDFGIRDKGIYHYLYSKLASSWEDLKNNKITIITFNYDRSLEHFLFGALTKSYNKVEKEVAEAIQKYIPIIHVHGSLGPLPWQNESGSGYVRLFGGGIDAYQIGHKIRTAIENIIIVSEANPKTNEFQLAAKHLYEADRIYFLGFGYNENNLGRLGIWNLHFADKNIIAKLTGEKPENAERIQIGGKYIIDTIGNFFIVKHLRGSAYEMGAAERRSIQEKWNISLPDNISDALKFLKEYADLN